MLCGDGGKHYLVQIKFQRNDFIFYVSLQFFKLIKQYFQRERLDMIYYLRQFILR